MAVIEEKTAWDILKSYAVECARIDSLSLVALFAIGSLPGGYYRPGQSDIDAVLIVADGSEAIWGASSSLTTDAPSNRLADLNKKYRQHYDIPKDFGPFPLQPHELLPPYDPNKELTLEIARLKLQGKLVYGAFSMQNIPMPAKKDFLADFKQFEEWWDNDFAGKYPPERFSLTACSNTILAHLNRYLIIEKGIIQFDKRQIIPLCLANNGLLLDKQQLDVVQKHLELKDVAEAELKELRQYAVDLRRNMNSLLKIR